MRSLQASSKCQILLKSWTASRSYCTRHTSDAAAKWQIRNATVQSCERHNRRSLVITCTPKCGLLTESEPSPEYDRTSCGLPLGVLSHQGTRVPNLISTRITVPKVRLKVGSSLNGIEHCTACLLVFRLIRRMKCRPQSQPRILTVIVVETESEHLLE